MVCAKRSLDRHSKANSFPKTPATGTPAPFFNPSESSATIVELSHHPREGETMNIEVHTQPAPNASDHGDCPFEFARHVHSYLQEFVRSSDQKAAFLLLAGTALFGLIYKEPA